MAKNNELALAFKFKDAPPELKKSAEVHQANHDRLEKAKAQLSAWQKEMMAAEIEFGVSAKDFRMRLNDWEPDGKKEDALEVFKTAKVVP